MLAAYKEIRDYIVGRFKGNLVDGDLTKRIRDLKIDSLDLVEFVMAVEEKFDVEISTDEIDQDMTLEQFCQLVDKHK